MVTFPQTILFPELVPIVNVELRPQAESKSPEVSKLLPATLPILTCVLEPAPVKTPAEDKTTEVF